MVAEVRPMYYETVDMLQNLNAQQLNAAYSFIVDLRKGEEDWESPLGIISEEQLWEHIDHSLAQIDDGKVAPAQQASQTLRAKYGL